MNPQNDWAFLATSCCWVVGSPDIPLFMHVCCWIKCLIWLCGCLLLAVGVVKKKYTLFSTIFNGVKSWDYRWAKKRVLTLSASRPLQSLLPSLKRRDRVKRCQLSQACQGRRDISRWHSGMVPVKCKQYGAQDSVPLPPLQPSFPTHPVSPTSSQYGLFHPVGGTTYFLLTPNFPHLFFFKSLCGILIFLSKPFVWSFKAVCSCRHEMLTQQCFIGF